MDPLFELALCVKASARELERRQNEAMRPLGLTAAQADALVVIGAAAPLSLKDLGEVLIAEAGHPSRLVDRLVERGLVARRGADDDRRRVVLTLTPAGARLLGGVLDARQAVLDLARSLVAGRDVGPTVELFRDLLAVTPYASLIERRLALESGRAPVAPPSALPPRS